tara:strand:- start:321 stop:743 length:423 start_codon:yes stop_codon:yes gene_type:complete
LEFVVDTNILFTYFWKQSFTKKILMNQKLRLFSPEFSLEEINNYKSEIIKKTNITEKEFNNIRMDLAIAVEFIPITEYKEFLKQALKTTPDKNDIDFIALALKLKLPIWSNDSLLKNQDKVKIFSTSDLMSYPKFINIIS